MTEPKDSANSSAGPLFRLDGKVAVVTGAGTGIGRAIALGLAQAGANVAAVFRSDVDGTLDELSRLPISYRPYRCDFEQVRESEIVELVASIEQDFGGLDILVNNAGMIHVDPAVDYPLEEWQRTLQVNLTSAFTLAKAVGRSLAERGQGGRIINIASLLSFLGGDSVVAYTASKSGLAGVTKALAVEWGARGVCVNAIAPGYVVTENTRRLREDRELKKAVDDRIPIGRWADPSDMVGPAVFLASDAARYVNGVILPVDGGLLAQ